MKVLPRSRGPKVNKNDIRETTHFSFFSEMKTIALYVVVGFSGIIFVIADEQGNAGCDHRMYVQYLPTYVVVFSLFIHNYVCLLLKSSLGSIFVRFLSTCCSDDWYGIHNNDTITKICSGMYASFIDISYRDK